MTQDAVESPPLEEIPAPRSPQERLELARNLFGVFHGRCFWHCRRDLEITEEDIPFVAKGLRTYGGHRGFALAGKLLPPNVSLSKQPGPG